MASTLTRIINNIFYVLQDSFVLFTFESIPLKYIYSGLKFEPAISSDMWPHVFIYLFGLYVPFLWLHTRLIFFPLIYDNCQITLKMVICWYPMYFNSWVSQINSIHMTDQSNIFQCKSSHCLFQWYIILNPILVTDHSKYILSGFVVTFSYSVFSRIPYPVVMHSNDYTIFHIW